MITDSTDMFIVLLIGSSFLMIIVIYLDRRITRHRSLVANKRYRRYLHEGRRYSPLHLVGSENRGRLHRYQHLVIGPETLVKKPGFFSRRRLVTDGAGQIVATHYEELHVSAPYASQTQLMLTA